MSIRDVGTVARHYILLGVMIAGSWFVSHNYAASLSTILAEGGENASTLIAITMIVIVFALGFLVVELAKPTVIPSFVLAIFFGIAVRDLLAPVTQSPESLSTIITIGATLILFGGGLDTPFQKFRALLGPILSLAFFGTLLNAFLFSLILVSLADIFSLDFPLSAIVLLGAAIASTDPAAIIPSFEGLFFTHTRVKHIAVSESALNDVVGAVLVTIFLSVVLGDGATSVFDAYRTLFTVTNLIIILRVIAVGSLVGVACYGILLVWSRWKGKVQGGESGDSAFFLGIPLLAFAAASILGGSGYLATFLASLLFRVRSHFRHVEHYFNHTIEGFMKPAIFMLLGAIVDPSALLAVAPVGIVSGVMFMGILRPLVVLVSLFPFCLVRRGISISELVFLSFVRETGVIPAALLISLHVAGVPGSETIMAIGLWVILLTLIIEPPLTPWLARRLGLATARPPVPTRHHAGPVAVLCSRGYSFPERMHTVVEWADQHGVDNIILLHCPEERYSPEYMEEIRDRAMTLFRSLNRERENEGRPEMNFELLGGPGLLQDNIESLIAEGDVSIIFVGTKMLDYRMEDVKRLPVPFYFMT